MTDAGEPTEPTPAAPAAESDADADAGPPDRRPGVVLPLWALAVGAVACLLLGSALTFVGVRANDDGGFRPALAGFEGEPGRGGRGGPFGGGRGGPGFGPPGGGFHDEEREGNEQEEQEQQEQRPQGDQPPDTGN